jgi:NAD+ synthase (glutamine-hydrolysing)
MLTLGLAQINPTVGDLDYNLALARDYLQKAQVQGVDLLLFPELSICGYPPEDLLLRRGFLSDCENAISQLAAEVENMVVLAGFPELEGRNPYNALAVLADGGVRGIYRKHHLPNYGVFDENRYFARGPGASVFKINGVVCGLSICEDIWYGAQPLADEILAGAEIILNASASPYHAHKGGLRQSMLAQRARDNVSAIAYCNLIGGQDELVFDGQSLVLDHHGRVLARAQQFEEQLLVCAIDCNPIVSTRLHDTRNRDIAPSAPVRVLADLQTTVPSPKVVSTIELAPELNDLREVYTALCLGVRDYVRKNGFISVLLGLSGGIDSALVALIAADAVGSENVTAVVMPSSFSSNATQGDARKLAHNLGLKLIELPISDVAATYENALANEFVGMPADITEENLQARIRGNFLMAISNKFGSILLSTGNKSEMSVGYSTLYGDMNGGLAVIKDVPKTLVFALTEWRNQQNGEGEGEGPVPGEIITRPPSAELAPNQKDTDSLPPYEILDPILERYIEDDESVDDIVAAGFERAVVERVARLVGIAEYKRRQAPPGIKITTRAFGRDRRMPITNGYRGRS